MRAREMGEGKGERGRGKAEINIITVGHTIVITTVRVRLALTM